MKQLVGRVTEKERDEIRCLFERRNGLNELAKILSPENSELYELMVTDLGRTTGEFQQWWNSMAEKYVWKSSPNGHWEIDFDSCEIYLID